MSRAPSSVDVLVIGGGPAGTATAFRAAQLGHTVCLVENGSGFWGRGFAQSLPPSVMPMLDVLGVRAELETEFTRSPGVTVLWGGDRPKRREFEEASGFQIERGAFDQMLCEAAARTGTIVLKPANVVDVRRSPAAATPWLAEIEADGERFGLRASIVVDAAGRRGKIPAVRTLRVPPLLCILGEWAACDLGTGSVVEAAPNAWYWACVPRGRPATVAVFFDPRSGLSADRVSLASAYNRLIGASRLLGDKLPGSPVRVAACDASSRFVQKPLDQNLIRVGESALTLDPLSSQGIQTSLASGLQAAIVANTWLRRPTCAMAADVFYRERHEERVRRSQINSSKFYGEAAERFGTPFWLQRCLVKETSEMPEQRPPSLVPDPLVRLRLGSGVGISRTAVVRGDFAEYVHAIVPVNSGRAVAFHDGVPVGDLASRLMPGTRALDVVQAWSGVLGEAAALRTLAWMWQTGIVVADIA
ncbi:flavin-dependent monooxygenase QhpG [Ensifer aridi]|uniref:flavin-dependent monooxygenase QhpG n=1 Tax=Ensifer aridi TaxID=1708715 RepID=UPI000A108E1D|nr:FAD-dependent oxidoreductase [Ensifer aridi]